MTDTTTAVAATQASALMPSSVSALIVPAPRVTSPELKENPCPNPHTRSRRCTALSVNLNVLGCIMATVVPIDALDLTAGATAGPAANLNSLRGIDP